MIMSTEAEARQQEEAYPIVPKFAADSQPVTMRFDDLPLDYVLDTEGNPWFIGKDVCAALGYLDGRKAIQDHIDQEDMITVSIRNGIRGNPNKTLINESGMYSLILRSNKPEAKPFKRWVTSVVLPSIRKTGAYSTPAEAQASGQRDCARDEAIWKALETTVSAVTDLANMVRDFVGTAGTEGAEGKPVAQPAMPQPAPLQNPHADDQYVSPTTLGNLLASHLGYPYPLPATSINKLLRDLGLQTSYRTRNGSQLKWKPTESGQAHIKQVNMKHYGWTLWNRDMLPLIVEALRNQK